MHPGSLAFNEQRHIMAQIYERLRDDLEKTEIDGKRHEVILVPAALLWLDARTRFGSKAWDANPTHGTAIARYTSGCMMFTYLTRQDPRKNSFRELPKNWTTSPSAPRDYVNDKDAQWLKDQVWLYYSTRPRQ